jgi:hypothetical protein
MTKREEREEKGKRFKAPIGSIEKVDLLVVTDTKGRKYCFDGENFWRLKLLSKS